MSSIDDIKHSEAIARALLDSPTPAAPAPAPNNTVVGGATAGDPYRGRYNTTAHGPLAPLRPKGLR